jgi:hypothetical protein
MATVYLSTAYLAPVQYYCKLYTFDTVMMEKQENYLKQTYRNRCLIATANGIQSLSIPVENPQTGKCLTKDIRISEHGKWRHLHWNALVSAYRVSPFFEYYQDELAPFYEQKNQFLFDFNEQLRLLVCELIDIQPNVKYTNDYQSAVQHDFRELIRPKHAGKDESFDPQPYYQVFGEKFGFLSNLSIVDLLFNMGPEAVLVLQRSVRHGISQ